MTFAKKLIPAMLLIALGGCDVAEDIRDFFFGEAQNTRRGPDTPQSSVELDCRIECQIGAETSNCLLTNISVSRPEYKTNAFEFRDMLEQGRVSGRIPKENVLSLFDNSDDPCGRGDIFVGNDGRFTNLSEDSDQCYLGYRSRLIGEIGLFVPQKLTGQLQDADDGDGFDLVFDTDGERLEVIVAREALNNEIGGVIRRLSVTNNRSIIQTQNICIASNL